MTSNHKLVDTTYYRKKKAEAEEFEFVRDEGGHIIRKIKIVKEGEPKIIHPIVK
jgi:hypothetical protein